MGKILEKGAFDIEAHRKARQSKAAKTDLVSALRQISPEVEKLKVGQTAVIENVEAGKLRSVVMSITAKLSHLTARGGEWAGREYGVASDSETGTVYVQRQTGCKPEDAPIRATGGGRPKGSKNKPESAEGVEDTTEADNSEETTATTEEGAKVVEHA